MNAAGRAAERRVRRHYRLRGYSILGRNVRRAGGEVDLIVRRGSRLVFCEVRMRSQDALVSPLESVDAAKRRRLWGAAEAWLASRRDLWGLDVELEVAAVQGRRIERYALSADE